MEQAHQAVAVGHLLHGLHGQLVVVAGGVGVGEDGRHLVLGGGNLVVLGLGVDAQLPQLFVEILHKGGDPGLDGAEVVVIQLLPLGGLGTEEGAAAELQVFALVVERFIHQEVLLLGADAGGDLLGSGVAPKSRSTRTAWRFTASMDRSSGVFLSSASPE